MIALLIGAVIVSGYLCYHWEQHLIKKYKINKTCSY